MGAGAGPQRADAPADALGELKSLLFGAEARRLEGLEAELRALALSRLPRAELTGATAAIIAEALREAEVDRHRELSDALAPLIVAAIRAEIRNSRESMVEALYPLMGRLVSASVANAFRDLTAELAERIDALISTRRWRWRLKSWATGRPVAEIALAEARRGRIVRVIALERGSGAPIAVWPQEVEEDSRSGLVSGLIAAITEFAAETFAHEGGALRALDLGARRVLLRSSATLIVAAECEGELHTADEAAVDEAFLKLLRLHDRTRELTAGDLSTLESAIVASPEKPGRAAVWVVRIAATAAVLALAVWTYGAAQRWWLERRVRAEFAQAQAAAPAIGAFPLALDVDHAARRVTLRGLSPDPAETDRLAGAVAAAAAPYWTQTQVETIATDASISRAQAQWGERARALDAEAAALRAELDARAAALDGADRERTQALARDLAAAKAEAETRAAGLARDVAAAQARLATQTQEASEARRAVAAAQEAAQAKWTGDLRETSRATAEALDRLSQRAQALAKDVAALQASHDAPREQLRRLFETSAIFFGRGAEFADPAAAAALADKLAGLIKQSGEKIRVVGHTDETGQQSTNLERSRERAEAAARLLTERGVPPHLMVTASRRAVFPIADATSPTASSNRRVTFELQFTGEPR